MFQQCFNSDGFGTQNKTLHNLGNTYNNVGTPPVTYDMTPLKLSNYRNINYGSDNTHYNIQSRTCELQSILYHNFTT